MQLVIKWEGVWLTPGTGVSQLTEGQKRSEHIRSDTMGEGIWLTPGSGVLQLVDGPEKVRTYHAISNKIWGGGGRRGNTTVWYYTASRWDRKDQDVSRKK